MQGAAACSACTLYNYVVALRVTSLPYGTGLTSIFLARQSLRVLGHA